MASVPQQSWNMVSGLLLSVLGDETLVTRLLQQDWVGTWEGWQEVDIHQPGTCEDAARRLLQISKDHAPLVLGSDAERLEQLREEGRHLWPASPDRNNCLLDSTLQGMAGNCLLPEQILFSAGSRAGARAACRRFLCSHADL